MCVFCVHVRKREISHSLTCSLSLSLSLSHPHCCHPPIPTVNQPPWQLCLRRWHNGRDWSYLLSCMMGGVCACVCAPLCVCVCLWVVSPFPVSGLSVCFRSPHLQAECLSLLSIYPSLFFFICHSFPLPSPSLLEIWGHCRAEWCWVLFSCCCQLSPRALQDKAVIAPGTAGLSSSSSKQICCNFICNWALNWEQIEAAL